MLEPEDKVMAGCEAPNSAILGAGQRLCLQTEEEHGVKAWDASRTALSMAGRLDWLGY